LLSPKTVPVRTLSRRSSVRTAHSRQGFEKGRDWSQMIGTVAGPFVTSVAVPIFSSLAVVAVSYFTFFHNVAVEDADRYKTILEAAVSSDESKQLTAVRMVAYLAKSKAVGPAVGLSVLQIVARTAKQKDLRDEAVDATENLFRERDSLDFDSYDRLELLTLRAALAPAEIWRRESLSKIEQDPVVTKDPDLKRAIELKLLALIPAVSDHPQTVIDLLLSIASFADDRDIIAREVALLRNAIKSRAKSVSAKDVADYLNVLATENKTDTVKLWLYLMRCLATEGHLNSQPNFETNLESAKILLKEQPSMHSEIECFLDDVVEEAPPDNDELKKIVETVRSRVMEPSLAKK